MNSTKPSSRKYNTVEQEINERVYDDGNVYFRDSVVQLLEYKNLNPDNETDVEDKVEFLRQYFEALRNGTHILLREYEFIIQTFYNRTSFLNIFWKSVKPIVLQQGSHSALEYHSLLCLICPDFSELIVERTVGLISDWSPASNGVSIVEFVYAFGLQFCYEDFITTCAWIYRGLILGETSPDDKALKLMKKKTLLVNTKSEEGEKSEKIDIILWALANSESVNSKKYLQLIVSSMMNSTYKHPNNDIYREILRISGSVTFKSFMTSLYKSDELIKELNEEREVLPSRSELQDLIQKDALTCTRRDISVRSQALQEGEKVNDKITSTPSPSIKGRNSASPDEQSTVDIASRSNRTIETGNKNSSTALTRVASTERIKALKNDQVKTKQDDKRTGVRGKIRTEKTDYNRKTLTSNDLENRRVFKDSRINRGHTASTHSSSTESSTESSDDVTE